MKTPWMKFAIFAILLLTRAVSAAENWPALPFAEVRAYAWPDDPDKKGKNVILAGMKLRKDVINPDGAILSPTPQQSGRISLLSQRSSES